MKSRSFLKLWAVLSLFFMVILHHLQFNFNYVFPFELIFIAPLLLLKNSDVIAFRKYDTTKIFLISFALLAVINIISSFWSSLFLITDFKANISFSITYILMLIYFIYGALLSRYISKREIAGYLLFFFILVFLISVLEYIYVPVRVFLNNFYDVEQVYLKDFTASNYRIIGLFKNPNSLAVVVIILLIGASRKYKSEIYIFSLISMAGVIIAFSGSRTGLVLLIVYILYVTFFQEKTANKKISATFLLLILGGWMIYNIDFDSISVLNRIGNSAGKALFENRINIYWNKTLELISSFPILGSGISHGGSITVDNFLLNVLKANGIIGLTVFLAPVLFLLINSFKNFKNGAEIKLLIIIFFLSSMTGDYYRSRPIFTIFFTLIGYYGMYPYASKKIKRN
ncbi:O-antigen ligase family protein [Fodinibius sp. SL11]|uniref:O-antigen ligase family protein n=1 Tax=Fodinibius sp. SL11 TaxID=3425690 RepID=UPI003F88443E